MQVGLARCGISTAAPVGTTFDIWFLVHDDGMPASFVSVKRTITITNPCPERSEHYCDGACTTLTCDAHAAITAGIIQQAWAVAAHLRSRSRPLTLPCTGASTLAAPLQVCKPANRVRMGVDCV